MIITSHRIDRRIGIFSGILKHGLIGTNAYVFLLFGSLLVVIRLFRRMCRDYVRVSIGWENPALETTLRVEISRVNSYQNKCMKDGVGRKQRTQYQGDRAAGIKLRGKTNQYVIDYDQGSKATHMFKLTVKEKKKRPSNMYNELYKVCTWQQVRHDRIVIFCISEENNLFKEQNQKLIMINQCLPIHSHINEQKVMVHIADVI